ncbi:ATP12 ATPase [Nitzschia inconspicua]|uniref:ATP12 ATPase n=1 Tax=Nitzschia inconspicua TaxID=303405 RepID=A0A9K3PL46_9STRA|nr:ATP12 ATPase [Nitzschia inconspicua]
MTLNFVRGANRWSAVRSARQSVQGCNPSSSSSRFVRGFSTKKSTTSRDTRLAGRPRFYKNVDITPLDAAPWETISSVVGSNHHLSSSSDSHQSSIDSPISAGVDGSQSATGVHHIPENAAQTSHFEWMLTPRLPGDTDDPRKGTATASHNISWYGVTLDGKTLSTPMGQKLALPSKTLAYMVAAEWDAQTTRLQPTNMPFMTMACTVLDQAAFHPDVYRKEALKFLPTDTTCFWADPTEDRILHRRQEKAWADIHAFCHKRLGAKPTTAIGMEGILMSRQRGSAKPFAGLPHPIELMEAARKWTESLDAWQLVALNSINTQAKSFLVGFSMLDSQKTNHERQHFPFPSVEKAVEASRVEEEFQISNWGLVEGGHDYDRVNCSIQLNSAGLFAKTILMDNCIAGD